MSTIYVLIMIWGGSTSQSGLAIVQQEFDTYERCEIARKYLVGNNTRPSLLRSQGCFKK